MPNHRPNPSADKIKVLIVDDSASVRTTLSAILSDDPEIEVMGTAADPYLAAEKIRKEVPDVLFLDIEMPRMDGFEVATHVRHDSRLQDVPIIMITSRTGEKHRERAFDIGVNCYMGKPFQENELLSTIRELLGELQETGGE